MLFRSNRKAALKLYEKGLHFAQIRLYFLSSLYFYRAWKNDKLYMSRQLDHLMNVSLQEGREGEMLALVSGLVVLRFRRKSPELANRLGEIAASNGHYRQAKNLFHKALRAGGGKIAQYNLIAVEGRIPVYGATLEKLYDKYIVEEDFLYPLSYKVPKFIPLLYARMQKELNFVAKEDEAYDTVHVAGRNAELLGEAYPHRFFTYLLAKADTFKTTLVDQQDLYFYYLFNIALYALQIKASKEALKLFYTLHDQRFAHKYMRMLEGISYWLYGWKGKALKIAKAYYLANKRDRLANYNLGQMYKMQGNEKKAYPLLLRAAFLLDASKGIETQGEIFKVAETLFEQQDYTKSLYYFNLLIKERPYTYPLSYMYVGKILWLQDKRSQAIEHFKEMLSIGRYVAIATKELRIIYDFFIEEGESFINSGHKENASKAFIEAYNVIPSLALADRIATLNTEIGYISIAKQFATEKKKLQKQEETKQAELKYQNHIKEARQAYAVKDYDNAINSLYKALVYQETKDEILLLAKLLKIAGRNDEMEEVNNRWQSYLKSKEIIADPEEEQKKSKPMEQKE